MYEPGSRPTWSQLITPSVFRNILNELHEGVALLEPELESPAPRFIYANAAFTRITGYPEHEVVGLPLEALTGDRGDNPAMASLLDTLGAGHAAEGECFARTRSGAELVVGLSLRPVVQDDVLLYAVCVLRDRTAERRMETIAHAATLAHSTANIFAGIRHEIGNPINSIKAALSLVRDRLDSFPREKTADYLDRTLAEIERIEFLLKAMRSFTAHERPNIQLVDPKALLERLVVLALPELERRQIAISTSADQAIARVRVDPRALYQVLLNLVLNAADALESRENKEIRVSLTGAGSRVLLRVEDNGVGVQPRDLPHVFDPFFTTKATGTGLGLGICQRLCAAMNATVRLESEPGLGTTAIVDLEAEAPNFARQRSSHR